MIIHWEVDLIWLVVMFTMKLLRSSNILCYLGMVYLDLLKESWVAHRGGIPSKRSRSQYWLYHTTPVGNFSALSFNILLYEDSVRILLLQLHIDISLFSVYFEIILLKIISFISFKDCSCVTTVKSHLYIPIICP